MIDIIYVLTLTQKVTSNFSIALGVGIRHSNTSEPALGTGAIMQQAMLSFPICLRLLIVVFR